MISLSQKAWQWLGRELDAWSEVDRNACFWWRDDDAVEPSDALGRLVKLCADNQVPLALAVIPAKCKSALADFTAEHSLVSALQHGYAHDNHAAPGQPKLELGGERSIESILADLRLGYDILEQQFGKRFCPVLVPPWNRIDAALIAELPAMDLRGVSTFRVCKQVQPIGQLCQVNAHLDPINWRHNRGFIGTYPAVAVLVQHLLAKRSGYRNADEPTGILSHHLVQNDAVWNFIEQLMEFLSNHPAVTWLDAPTIWK